MNLTKQSRGDVSIDPQSVNIRLACDLCGRTIPPGEEYYDIRVNHGDGTACADHGLDDVCEWAGQD